jgi:hypothetical protein
MKAKKPVQEKEFDTVKTFRAIKEQISLEMAKINSRTNQRIFESK